MLTHDSGFLDRIRNIDVNEPDIWTQYWKLGYRSTSGNWPLAGPDDSMLRFWQAQFVKFPHVARILDIGCGNGELTCRVHDYSLANAKQWQVTGIDRARIGNLATESGVAHAQAQSPLLFFGEMSVENLKLENASQDVVVAQHALEYTQLSKTVAEISRVCDDDAQVFLVLHMAASVVALNAESDIQDHLKIRASGFFDPAFLSHPRATQRKLRWDFHETGSDLIEFAAGLSAEFNGLNETDRLAFWHKACAYFDNDFKRLAALLVASQTPEQRLLLVELLVENQFEVVEARALRAPDLSPAAYFIAATRLSRQPKSIL